MATLVLVWQALSPLGLLLGASGAGVLVVVALGLVALPGWLSRPAIVLGAGFLAGGLLYQTAYARATHAAELRRERAVAAANLARARAAESALAHDRARAAADSAALDALRKEIDATPLDPAGCLPADAAERLRRIR